MSVEERQGPTIRESVTEIVKAHLARSDTPAAEVPGLVRTVFETFRDLEAGALQPGSAAQGVTATAASPASQEASSGETQGNSAAATGAVPLVPAVPIDQSVGEDFIICLEDGRRLRMLTRYIKRQFGLEPDEYRRKWNLPDDYPMSAASITAQRSAARARRRRAWD